MVEKFFYCVGLTDCFIKEYRRRDRKFSLRPPPKKVIKISKKINYKKYGTRIKRNNDLATTPDNLGFNLARHRSLEIIQKQSTDLVRSSVNFQLRRNFTVDLYFIFSR